MGFTGRTRYGRARWAKWLLTEARKNKYKPNDKSVEIIGLPSAVFTHITTDSVPGSLTQTTFDTTSRADSAQILLTNSTGSSKVIIAAWIRGKPVTRLSDGKQNRSGSPTSPGGKGGTTPGGGYLHDKYVDYESIAKNGEQTFETGNNFTVTADQVNRLADYYWKLNKTPKHIYTLSLMGFQSWYEPGEWYTLQIGGVGEAEYIDSTVECFEVRCSLSAGGAPSTSVSFREVEENWKFDSNEFTRYVASGGFSRKQNNNVVTVAAQYYSGYADYYCDGTNDQVEINSALNYLDSINGGICKLSPGNFNVTSSISLIDNVVFCGEGPNTVIVRNMSGSNPAIDCLNKNNITLNNMTIDRTSSDTQVDDLVSISGTDYSMINNVHFLNPMCHAITISDCDSTIVKDNFITRSNSTAPAFGPPRGIAFSYTVSGYANVICSGNVVTNFLSSGGQEMVAGISVYVATALIESRIIVTNNTIDGVVSYDSSLPAHGIYLYGSGIVARDNYVINTKCSGGTAIGIIIASGSTNASIAGNYCFNNGADTGIANTNGDNFTDNGTDTQWAG